MHFLIVDDEAPARAELARLLQEVAPQARRTEAVDLTEARRALLGEDIDAVFLDLGMPGASGFELFPDATVASVPVIITTAHEEHAIEAIDRGAVGYLLKPIETDKLSRAILRLEKPRKAQEEQLIILSDQNHYWPLSPDDIVKIEADGGCSEVSTADGRVLVLSRTLKQIEQELNRRQFVRANRSAIINLTHAKVIHRTAEGEVVADMGAAGNVPFSRRQAQVIRKGKNL